MNRKSGCIAGRSVSGSKPPGSILARFVIDVQLLMSIKAETLENRRVATTNQQVLRSPTHERYIDSQAIRVFEDRTFRRHHRRGGYLGRRRRLSPDETMPRNALRHP